MRETEQIGCLLSHGRLKTDDFYGAGLAWRMLRLVNKAELLQ